MSWRTFTLQAYDQPVHFHMCPECRQLKACRLPRCNLRGDSDPKVREDRYCTPCRHELLRQDIPEHTFERWCEHCGGDVAQNGEWQQRWPGERAAKPHDPWCLFMLIGPHPQDPLDATRKHVHHCPGCKVNELCDDPMCGGQSTKDLLCPKCVAPEEEM